MAGTDDWIDPRAKDFFGLLPSVQSAPPVAPPDSWAGQPAPLPEYRYTPPIPPQQFLSAIGAPAAPDAMTAVPTPPVSPPALSGPVAPPPVAPVAAPAAAPEPDIYADRPGETSEQRIKRLSIANQSDIGAAWDVGVLGLKQLGAGVAGALGQAAEGTAIGDALGAGEVHDWGVEKYRALEQEMQPYQEGRVSQLEQIESIGDVGRFAAWSVGQMAPSIVESIGSALVGAAAGSFVPGAGTAAGAAGGFFAKAATKKFLADYAVKEMAKDVTGKVITKEIADAAAKRALAQTVGAGAAMFASSYAMGVGDIYGETMDEAGNGSVGMAALGALPYAALDAFTDLSVFKSILKGTGGDNVLARFAKGILTAGAKEGGAEAGQEAILILAGAQAGKEYDQATVMSRLGNSFAAAAIGGGVLGVGAGRKGPTDQERSAGTLSALATVGLRTAGENAPALNMALGNANADPAQRMAAAAQVDAALRGDGLEDLADLWRPMAEKAIKAKEPIQPTSVQAVATSEAARAVAAKQAAIRKGVPEPEAESLRKAMVAEGAKKAVDQAERIAEIEAGRKRAAAVLQGTPTPEVTNVEPGQAQGPVQGTVEPAGPIGAPTPIGAEPVNVADVGLQPVEGPQGPTSAPGPDVALPQPPSVPPSVPAAVVGPDVSASAGALLNENLTETQMGGQPAADIGTAGTQPNGATGPSGILGGSGQPQGTATAGQGGAPTTPAPVTLPVTMPQPGETTSKNAPTTAIPADKTRNIGGQPPLGRAQEVDQLQPVVPGTPAESGQGAGVAVLGQEKGQTNAGGTTSGRAAEVRGTEQGAPVVAEIGKAPVSKEAPSGYVKFGDLRKMPRIRRGNPVDGAHFIGEVYYGRDELAGMLYLLEPKENREYVIRNPENSGLNYRESTRKFSAKNFKSIGTLDLSAGQRVKRFTLLEDEQTPTPETPASVPQAEVPPTPVATKKRGRGRPRTQTQPAGAPAAEVGGVAPKRRGEVGGKLSAGEVVTTASGRETTPFPKFSTSTPRKAQNAVRKADRWLLENAALEAESRGDDFNAPMFRSALEDKTIPQATKDSAEEYLFGQQPPVIPPITRPLVQATAPTETPTPEVTPNATENVPGNSRQAGEGSQERQPSLQPSAVGGGGNLQQASEGEGNANAGAGNQAGEETQAVATGPAAEAFPYLDEPRYVGAMGNSNRTLYGVADITKRINDPQLFHPVEQLTPDENGRVYSVEFTVYELLQSKAFVKAADGRLRNRSTGDSVKELLKGWEHYNRGAAALRKWASENPNRWQAYQDRQAAVQSLKVGDEVRSPLPTSEDQRGGIGKITKKNRVTWEVTLLGFPRLYDIRTLRAVDADEAGAVVEPTAKEPKATPSSSWTAAATNIAEEIRLGLGLAVDATRLPGNEGAMDQGVAIAQGIVDRWRDALGITQSVGVVLDNTKPGASMTAMGATWRLTMPRDYLIALASQEPMARATAVETLFHEFGHAVDHSMFADLAQHDQKALQDAYKAWRTKVDALSIEEARAGRLTPLRAAAATGETFPEQTVEYVLSEAEWRADNVARALLGRELLTTNKAAESVFGKVAAKIRAAYKKLVKAMGYTGPDELIERLITGRLEKIERDAAARRMKARATVDPKNDNLLVAIAKLGGLSKDEAAGDFGDYSKKTMPVFGSPRVFRRDGLSFDDMAQQLAELHYPVTDLDGNYSTRALTDALDDALRGASVISVVGVETEGARLEQKRNEELAAQAELDDADIEAFNQETDASARDAFNLEMRHQAVDVLGMDPAEYDDIAAGAAAATDGGTQEDYETELSKRVGAARSARQSGQGQARPGNAQAPEALTLEGQTNADILAAEEAQRQRERDAVEAERKRMADEELPGFVLSGSNRPADEMAARGQTSLFDQPHGMTWHDVSLAVDKHNSGPAGKDFPVNLFELADFGIDPRAKSFDRKAVTTAILKAGIEGRVATRKRAQAVLVEANGGTAVGLELKHKDREQWAAILPDASEPGRFRYSLYDKRGFFTHATFDTAPEVLDEAIKDGYTERDQGAMDRLQETPEFQQGMDAAWAIQKENTESWMRSQRAKAAEAAPDTKAEAAELRRRATDLRKQAAEVNAESKGRAAKGLVDINADGSYVPVAGRAAQEFRRLRADADGLTKRANALDPIKAPVNTRLQIRTIKTEAFPGGSQNGMRVTNIPQRTLDALGWKAVWFKPGVPQRVFAQEGKYPDEYRDELIFEGEIGVAGTGLVEAINRKLDGEAAPEPAIPPADNWTPPTDPEKRAEQRQMYEDNIATKRERGEKISEQWLTRLDQIKAVDAGVVAESDEIVARQVFGHPMVTDAPEFTNLVPIKFKKGYDFTQRIAHAEGLLKPLQEKFGRAQAIADGKIKVSPIEKRKQVAWLRSGNASEDRSNMERLRNETMPELYRLSELSGPAEQAGKQDDPNNYIPPPTLKDLEFVNLGVKGRNGRISDDLRGRIAVRFDPGDGTITVGEIVDTKESEGRNTQDKWRTSDGETFTTLPEAKKHEHGLVLKYLRENGYLAPAGDTRFSRQPIISPTGRVPANATPTGLPVAQVQAIVDDFGARLLGASKDLVKVEVVAKQEDAFGPASRDRDGRVRGAWDPQTRTVVLVAENLGSLEQARTVLRHEVVAHYGLTLLSAADRAEFLRRVNEAVDGSRALRRIRDEVVRAEGVNADPMVIAEEVFARVAESGRSALGTAWDRLLLWLRGKLRAIGVIQGRPSLTEMRVVAADLARGIREGRVAAGDAGLTNPDIRFSFAGERAAPTLSSDLTDQTQFLQDQAKQRGFADPDEFLTKDTAGFIQAAEQWRDGHPRVAADGRVMFSRENETRVFPIKESDKESSLREKSGLDVLITVDAQKLKDAFEQITKEPLVHKQNRYDNISGLLDSGESIDAYPVVGIDYGFSIDNGRHRVAVAADRGMMITVATTKTNAQRIRDLLSTPKQSDTVLSSLDEAATEQDQLDAGSAPVAFTKRTSPAPKKTIKVYKAFRLIDGKLYTMFIGANDALPQGEWLDAGEGGYHFTDATNGREYTPTTDQKGMDSATIPNESVRQDLIRLGYLPKNSKAKSVRVVAYRPGWHGGELPFFPQSGISVRASNLQVGEKYPYKNVHKATTVIAEVELDADKNYKQEYENTAVRSANGKIISNKSGIRYIPAGGFYEYATNPMFQDRPDLGKWFISGSMKVGKILSRDEVNAKLDELNVPRQLWEDEARALTNLDIRFSRDLPSLATLSETISERAKSWLERKQMPASNNLSVLDRTILTPFNLSKRLPTFSRVYEALTQYNDTKTTVALNAESMAPNLFADQEHGLRKGWGSAQQVRRSANKREMALVEGALNELETLEDGTVANRKFTDAELRARGFNDNAIGTYRQTLKAAHYALDTSAQALQVKNLWNLLMELHADRGMKGYRLIQFTGDIAKRIMVEGGTSADAAANAERMLNIHLEPLVEQEANLQGFIKDAQQEVKDAKAAEAKAKDAVRTAETVQTQVEARKRVEDAQKMVTSLESELDHVQKLRTRIEDTAKSINGIADKVSTLKNRAYFPLMRFGKYTLTVWNLDENGNRTSDAAYFGRYETQDDLRRAVQEVTPMVGPNQELETGMANENAYELYQKINMDTLALFADYIDTHDETGEAQRQVDLLREYIRIGTADSSMLKRQLERKGTPGWSKDSRRVLASYILSAAAMSSSQLHMAEINGAIQAIPKEEGDVQQYALSLRDYVQEPGEELSGLRNFMFFWYMGGSLASAAVNLTQVPMVTFPFMTQYGSAKDVTRLIVGAYQTLKRGKGKIAEQDTPLGRAYKQAERDGIIAPQQIYTMMGTARGGTLGVSRLMRHPTTQFLQNLWSTPFAFAEQVNRSVTFIAAFNQAMEGGQTEQQALAFAKDAVDQTQLVYSKENRPAWSRGIAAPLFTFKLFTIQYLELLSRLPIKQKAYMMGLMFLAAGLGGLPGAEDLEDIFDTIAQVIFGKAWQTHDELKGLAEKLLGETMGQIAVEGISAAGLPIDLRRLGMGNIIPGTGALLPGGSGQLRAAGEVLGPTSGLIQDAMGAATNIGRGDWSAAGYTLVPKAIRAGIDGVKAIGTGVYEDTKGRTVMPVSFTEAAFKAIGFQPRRVAEYQQQKWSLQKRATLQRTMEDAFLDRMARARVAGDDAAYQAARQQVRDWNARNPTDRIEYTRGQILSRVKGIKAMSQDRFLKSLPPELRKEAMGAFGE